MSITIRLSPAVEAVLRVDAEAQGRDASEIAAERLSALYLSEAEAVQVDFDAWYASLPDEERAAEIIAIREGIDAGKAGRVRSAADVYERMNAKYGIFNGS